MSVVLITGCSSGIGLETALAFARRGDTTVATLRTPANAGALEQRATADGLDVHVAQLDVTDEASVEAAVAATLTAHGTIDVLVNNAGVGTRGPVETMSMDVAERVMDTNFWGPMRMIRAVLPAMREQGSGVIVNVSSLASRVPASLYTSMYAASKVALNALSEALAAEVSRFGIRVVSLEPGLFDTEIDANNLDAGEAPNDVYAADQTWIEAHFRSGLRAGADASVVADAIVAAANDPETRLHTTVGDDAPMYLGLLARVDGYEGWSEVLLSSAEASAGPRPGVE